MLAQLVRLMPIVVMFAIAACSQGEPETTLADFVEELASEVDQFELDRGSLEDAIAECMRVEGYDYVPVENVFDRGLDEDKFVRSINVSLLVPVERLKIAGSYGFFETAVKLNVAVRDGPMSADERVPGYEDALYGNPNRKGCQEQAAEKFGSVGRVDSLADEIDSHIGDVIDLIDSSPEFQTWAGCMRGEGFDVVSSADLGLMIRGQVFDVLSQDASLGGISIDDRGNPVLGDGAAKALEPIRIYEQEFAQADIGCNAMADGLREEAHQALTQALGHIVNDH